MDWQHWHCSVAAVLRPTAITGVVVRLLEVRSMNEMKITSSRCALLVLKRYETRRRDISTIFHARSCQRSVPRHRKISQLVERIVGQPWLGKLLQALNVKTGVASNVAGALCLLLFLGIIYGERPDLTSSRFYRPPPPPLPDTASLTPDAIPVAVTTNGDRFHTDPVFSLQPGACLFGQQNSLAQPVSFSLPRN